jgi:hypothetical protein
MNSVSCVAGNWSKRPFFGRLVCHGVSSDMTVRSVPLHGTVVAERLLK